MTPKGQDSQSESANTKKKHSLRDPILVGMGGVPFFSSCLAPYVEQSLLSHKEVCGAIQKERTRRLDGASGATIAADCSCELHPNSRKWVKYGASS
eukprot:1311421-Amphidinium_carterae.1